MESRGLHRESRETSFSGRGESEIVSMWGTASASWLLILGTTFAPERREWEVVRSDDGEFAFSMPIKPTAELQNVQGAAGTQETLTFSCLFNGSLYFIQ
jgi:hypothetical protein